MSEKTVELRHDGVENSIRVPAHRVDRYKARGWKRVTKSSATGTGSDAKKPGPGTTEKEK